MLTVHKNTRDQRESKRVRNGLLVDAKEIARMPNISGYAVVAWNSDFGTHVHWDQGRSAMPTAVIGEYVKQAFERELVINDAHRVVEGEE